MKAATAVSGYGAVLTQVIGLLESARRALARSVNAIMTATYWEIGRRVVELEQRGKSKADYGLRVVERLSRDLTLRFGRGFGRRNLFQMRAFFLAYPDITQTASAQSRSVLAALAARFPLPWSHYIKLLAIENVESRRFYETEAFRGGWSGRAKYWKAVCSLRGRKG